MPLSNRMLHRYCYMLAGWKIAAALVPTAAFHNKSGNIYKQLHTLEAETTLRSLGADLCVCVDAVCMACMLHL